MSQKTVIETARIIRGSFGWCGDTTIPCNYIRVNEGKPQDYLWIEFRLEPNVFSYSLRQAADGKSYDLQHPIKKDQSFLFLPLAKVDRSHPLYLFATGPPAKMFGPAVVLPDTRSEPIDLSAPVFEIGDTVICAICLEDLGQSRQTLICGHSFCAGCILKATKQNYCQDCARFGEQMSKLHGWPKVPTVHQWKIVCPVCRQDSV